MVLYLAGRCAITRDHLDHNRTLGLKFDVLSLPLSISFFFNLSFSVFVLSRMSICLSC